MDKPRRDQFGEIFEDDLTENETKADGPARDDVERTKKMDPGIDSQEADLSMAENRFGQNERSAATQRAQAVYADTDLDPNRDDQADAHSAAPDEHL